jgi:excisionase family DNA binding protein
MGGGVASARVVLRLLKVGEVAERLSVSAATVYALCKCGALPHVRVANAIRVLEAELEAFLDRDDRVARTSDVISEALRRRGDYLGNREYERNGYAAARVRLRLPPSYRPASTSTPR